MAHSRMPLKYWVESFRTATFLINQMPSKILNNESPWQKLFGKAPDYTNLRSFGCACFPFLRPYNSHRLQFRSTECVFLGYSPNHKGYRCLDVHSGRVYLSRHVVFDKTLFPFAKFANQEPALPLSRWIPPPSQIAPKQLHHLHLK